MQIDRELPRDNYHSGVLQKETAKEVVKHTLVAFVCLAFWTGLNHFERSETTLQSLKINIGLPALAIASAIRVTYILQRYFTS